MPALVRIALALALLTAGVAATPALAANTLTGTWTVTTRLVAAQEKINPGYEVGDERVETWRITTKASRSTLRTPAGVIKGKRVGKAWRYQGDYPIALEGMTLVLRMDIVARKRAAGRMKGTIEASYWDPRYARGGPLYDPEAEKGRESGVWDPKLGLKLGIDAWSFTGKRR